MRKRKAFASLSFPTRRRLRFHSSHLARFLPSSTPAPSSPSPSAFLSQPHSTRFRRPVQSLIVDLSSAEVDDAQLDRINLSSSANESDERLAPKRKQKVSARNQKKRAAQLLTLEQQRQSASASLRDGSIKMVPVQSFLPCLIRFSCHTCSPLTTILAMRVRVRLPASREASPLALPLGASCHLQLFEAPSCWRPTCRDRGSTNLL